MRVLGIADYRILWRAHSYRRRVGIKLLAFLGATASVGQVVLWLADVSGGPSVAIALAILIPMGIAFAITSGLPAGEVTLRHQSTDSTLIIHVGNLLDTRGAAVVVTMNRFFDTNRRWVSEESLIGQFKSRFSGDPDAAEFLASAAFNRQGLAPVGEIVDFTCKDTRYLFLAVTNRNAESRSSVVIDEIWDALNSLWQFARRNDISKLAVPIIGAGFAHAQVGQTMLLTLLLTSYSTASVERRVADLDLVIRRADADYELVEFAKSYSELVGYRMLQGKPITGRQIEDGNDKGALGKKPTSVDLA
jgi:hypothetical protein